MGVVYVAGLGRSGSSLLDYLLGHSQDIASTGELHRLSLAPRRRLCSCGASLSQCFWWERVRAAVSSLGSNVSCWESLPVTAQPSGWRENQLKLLAGVHAAFRQNLGTADNVFTMKRMAAIQNSVTVCRAIQMVRPSTRFVVDSTKSPLRCLDYFSYSDCPVRVVEIVRDGRAVVASHVRRTGASWWKSTLKWRAGHTKLKLIYSSIPPDRHLRVHYEDICATPLYEVNRIRRFLCLRELDQIPSLDPATVHMIPGNPVLLRGINNIQLDSRWKNEMSANALRVFRLAGGRLNQKLGYDPRLLA